MVSELNIFFGKWSKIAVQKKVFFSADFHSTWGQNWVHQQNNICVGALHFHPWCTLNLISSHDHFPGLSLVTAPGDKIGCINTTFHVLKHSILTLGALLTYWPTQVTSSLPRPLIVLVLQSASVERFDVSRMRDF